MKAYRCNRCKEFMQDIPTNVTIDAHSMSLDLCYICAKSVRSLLLEWLGSKHNKKTKDEIEIRHGKIFGYVRMPDDLPFYHIKHHIAWRVNIEEEDIDDVIAVLQELREVYKNA